MYAGANGLYNSSRLCVLMTSSCPYHFMCYNQLVMDDFVSYGKCATLICEGRGPIYTPVTTAFRQSLISFIDGSDLWSRGRMESSPEEIIGISWGYRGLGSFQAIYYCTCSKVACGLAVVVYLQNRDQIWFRYLSPHIVWAVAQFWGFKGFTCISI